MYSNIWSSCTLLATKAWPFYKVFGDVGKPSCLRTVNHLLPGMRSEKAKPPQGWVAHPWSDRGNRRCKKKSKKSRKLSGKKNPWKLSGWETTFFFLSLSLSRFLGHGPKAYFHGLPLLTLSFSFPRNLWDSMVPNFKRNNQFAVKKLRGGVYWWKKSG